MLRTIFSAPEWMLMRAVLLLLSSLLVLSGCVHTETRSRDLESPEDGALVMRYLLNAYPNAIRQQGEMLVEAVGQQNRSIPTQYRLTDTREATTLSTLVLATLPAGTYRLVGACTENLLCADRYKFNMTFTIRPGQLTDLGVVVSSRTNGDSYGSPVEPEVTSAVVQKLAPALKPLLQTPILTWNQASSDTESQRFERAKRESVGVYSMQALDQGAFLYGSINGVVYRWTPGQAPVGHDIGRRVSVESVLATPSGRWLAGGELGVLRESADQGATWHSVSGNLPFGVITSLGSWQGKVIATLTEDRFVSLYSASEGDSKWTLLARHAQDVSIWDPMLMPAKSTVIGDQLVTTVPGHKLATLDLRNGKSEIRDLPHHAGTFSVVADGVLRSKCDKGVCESRDLGKTWQSAKPSPLFPAPAFRDANHGVAINGELFAETFIAYTNDGGATWINAMPINPHVNQLFYNRQGNRVYAASQTGEFWESVDDGRHWKQLSKGLY